MSKSVPRAVQLLLPLLHIEIATLETSDLRPNQHETIYHLHLFVRHDSKRQMVDQRETFLRSNYWNCRGHCIPILLS